MTTHTSIDDSVDVQGAPAIAGLTFRRFRGDSDFPKMVAVLQRARKADQNDELATAEDMARSYANLKNCDPYKDVLIAEVGGHVVGYNRASWWKELSGTHVYEHFGQVAPEWRNKGIGRALLRHAEAHLRQIAAQHPADGDRLFDTGALNTQPGLISLLESEGYSPIRPGYDMVRPNLDNIPDAPLPEGMEVRPAKPEHYRAIWEAEVEAFRDHWGEWETEEADYPRWLNDPMFQPDLWQVAWEGDQVAGMVRNFINHEGNKQFGRLRGYTEYISVRRPWRRRGVARALIASSFHLHKQLGMTEAALGVDGENPNGALQLYQSMGFQITKVWTSYRKPLK